MWEKNVQTFMQKLEQNKNCNNEIPCLQLKLTSVGHPAISLENISGFSQKYIKINLTSIAINQTHWSSSLTRHEFTGFICFGHFV